MTSAKPQVSAFSWVPPFAEGFVRDLRVRWAMEGAGRPYEAVLIGQGDQASAEYRAWQPFGQVPAWRDGEVEMFESGAIVLRIAEDCEALCPQTPAGRARVTTWVIAALNSIEPVVMQLGAINLFHKGEAWTVERRPQVEADMSRRLTQLAAALGERDYLEGRFTAGDILMSTVLRELVEGGYLAPFPTLVAYVRRCEARPAFQRALADQLRPFREHAPAA